MSDNKYSTNNNSRFSNNHSLFFICCSLLFVLCYLFFASCSTTNKKPGDIEIKRIMAETMLEQGIRESGLGDFDKALLLLTESKRNSILCDDLSLIIRTCMARGNVLHSLGRTNEAFAEWEQAVDNAVRLNDQELLSVSKIYLLRGNLITEKKTPGEVLSEVTRESANIKKNKLYIAFSWQVIGLAHRALGAYKDAEAAFKKSLDIHAKDDYLDNAAYDWYIIASIRSLSGNTQGAVDALESSIVYDRRIENSWGIAASYRAMGDVYRKMGKQDEAREAYNRARTIYTAIGNEDEAAEMSKRIGS